MKKRIFVQIASYRDVELLPTIKDLLEKAHNPDLFSFGICWQYGPEEDPNIFDGKEQFRVMKIPHSLSQGLGWARSMTNTLYDGEELTLQFDSHHRFAQDWDKMMLEDYEQCLEKSSKPILSTYCQMFDPSKPLSEAWVVPNLMRPFRFSEERLLMSRPEGIQSYKTRTQVLRARTISAHFFLTQGKFIEEIPYDPEIFFGGYTEEATLSVRAFTHGYDIFSPYRQYIWHEYTRNYRPKHWDDHSKKSDTGKTSSERNTFSMKKTRQLFQQEDNGIVIESKYGLGSSRTLRDYEVFAGFDFKNCRIQSYTLNPESEPPNPPDYENQFKHVFYTIPCTWDLNHFLKEKENRELVYLTFGIETKTGKNIYRIDFLPETHPQRAKLRFNKYTANFSSDEAPHRLVMFAYWKGFGYGKQYMSILSSNQITASQ